MAAWSLGRWRRPPTCPRGRRLLHSPAPMRTPPPTDGPITYFGAAAAALGAAAAAAAAVPQPR
eukprot:12920902-Prorocentrum_lima.AAC.1